MEKQEKDFIIPLNDDEEIKEINKKYNQNLRTSEEAFEDMIGELMKMMDKACDGNYFKDDAFKIKIIVEYKPEEK